MVVSDRQEGPRGFRVREAAPGEAGRLAALQRKCLEVCPDMDEQPPVFFENPGFDGGRNIFCAVDGEGPGERLLGYALVFRLPDPAYLYLDVKVDPGLPDPEAVRDAVFERVLARAREIKAGYPPYQETLLYGCCFTSGAASLDYLAGKGFTRHEPLCVYTMVRDLSEPVPKVPIPLGVEVRPWALDTEEELSRYLLAHNASLPYNYLDPEAFRGLLAARPATVFGAFAGAEVAGSATVISGDGVGTIEYLFVSGPWRGRGVGRCLVRAALRHFVEKGLSQAELAVATENSGARALYESMGYRVTREAVSLAMHL